MRLILRCLLACFAIITPLCAVIIAAARTQPRTEFIPTLRICENVPCYMDVVLGKTTRLEAESILTTLPGMAMRPQTRTLHSTTGLIRSVVLYAYANDKIQEVDLFPAPATLTAGEMVNTLGRPCAVISYGAGIAVTYPGIGVFFSMRNGRFRLQSPVTQVSIFLPMMPCDNLAQGGGVSRIWHGFRQYSR